MYDQVYVSTLKFMYIHASACNDYTVYKYMHTDVCPTWHNNTQIRTGSYKQMRACMHAHAHTSAHTHVCSLLRKHKETNE